MKQPCEKECARANEIGYGICQSCPKAVTVPDQMDCEMGSCPANFDRKNTACAGCRHNKARVV